MGTVMAMSLDLSNTSCNCYLVMNMFTDICYSPHTKLCFGELQNIQKFHCILDFTAVGLRL